MHTAVLALAFFAVPCLVLAFVFFFRRVYVTPSAFRSGLINAATLLTTLALTALAAESFFYFDVQSDGFGMSLAQQRWKELYSGPTNSFGYRDNQPPPKSSSKHFIVALGDSFTYGQGIKNIEDRYQNRLAREVGADWVSVTVASSGWDTVQELEALKRSPRKPDILILQYFVNDIQDAALSHGLNVAPSPQLPGFPLGFIIKNSYLADFIYWRLFGILSSSSVQYWDQLKKCYWDDAIWRDHENAIKNICHYTQEQKIPTLVVVFPHLQSVVASTTITQKVSSAFRACGLNVLDLTPILTGRSPRELMCNPYDSHPSLALHKEVSVLLYEKLKQLYWIPGSKKPNSLVTSGVDR